MPAMASGARRAVKATAKAIGWECRHLPSCSEYALEAIDRNGAWRGSWLALSRVCRCHPWGSQGLDPVPDIAQVRHPLAPWRYGQWRLRRSL
jgi:putative membrane protein insertion efficiency factor